MKTTWLLSLGLLSFLGMAQEHDSFGFKKHDIFTSGSINYYDSSNTSAINSDYNSNGKNTALQVVPEVGYFVSDHFAIGVKAAYHRNSSNYQNEYANDSIFVIHRDANARGYGAHLYGRYYFSPKKRISVFTEIEAGYNRNKENATYHNDSESIPENSEGIRKGYSIGISPGINIFLTQNLSLTTRIGRVGFAKSTYKEDIESITDRNYTSKNENFSASIGLDNLFFGVLYRI